MQQKIFFLSIEGSFSTLSVALYQNLNVIEKISSDNLKASSSLICILETLLKKNSVKLSDVSFIAVNQGPGAFTSLRVVIATINGISFSTGTPLIGVDGLDSLSATLIKQHKKKTDILIPCLNAYGNDIHFSINKIDKNLNLKKIYKNQYKKIDALIKIINTEFQGQKILIGGNGASLHKEQLINEITNSEIIFDTKTKTTSTEQIATLALEKWNQTNKGSKKLLPLYLKSQNFLINANLKIQNK